MNVAFAGFVVIAVSFFVHLLTGSPCIAQIGLKLRIQNVSQAGATKPAQHSHFVFPPSPSFSYFLFVFLQLSHIYVMRTHILHLNSNHFPTFT